jgi:hypothetical protein
MILHLAKAIIACPGDGYIVIDVDRGQTLNNKILTLTTLIQRVVTRMETVAVEAEEVVAVETRQRRGGARSLSLFLIR